MTLLWYLWAWFVVIVSAAGHVWFLWFMIFRVRPWLNAWVAKRFP